MTVLYAFHQPTPYPVNRRVFSYLDATKDQLDFPVIYASGRDVLPYIVNRRLIL